MRKIILTSAAAALIGVASMATASAQMATGTNEGMSNTMGMTNTGDARMNANNKMKKKKMKRGNMQTGMGSSKMGSGAVQGGQAPGSMGGGMQGGGMSGGGMSGGGMQKKM